MLFPRSVVFVRRVTLPLLLASTVSALGPEILRTADGDEIVFSGENESTEKNQGMKISVPRQDDVLDDIPPAAGMKSGAHGAQSRRVDYAESGGEIGGAALEEETALQVATLELGEKTDKTNLRGNQGGRWNHT